MSNETKKTYVANLKTFGNYGSIKGRIYADKTTDLWETDDKGRKYLPIIINVNKEPDQYGNTHSVILDTWKPEAKAEAAPAPVKKAQPKTVANDLPF